MKKIIVSPLCTASICLSVTLLAAGLAAQIAAALVPNIILPALDIPTLAALSLLALVLEVILFGENHRFWATSLIVGTVAFGVLSLCAGSVPTVLDALRVGILGGAVFLICEVLLHSILDRISSGAAGKYPRSMAVVSALLLWRATGRRRLFPGRTRRGPRCPDSPAGARRCCRRNAAARCRS